MRADDAEWVLGVRGPTTLERTAESVPLRPRERAVLAALAVAHPKAASVDRLITLVWGEHAPASARKSLQNHVARVRSITDGVIVTTTDGYRLGPDVLVLVDADANEGAVPFADLADGDDADHARRVATRVIRAATADRLRSHLDAGLQSSHIVELEALVSSDPTDEAGWHMLVRGLAQLGRRREALAALNESRTALATAGLPLGQDMRDLERRLLGDDPTLRTHRGERSTPARSSPTGHLVGLEQYVDQIDRLPDGAVQVVVLTGEAGIGKTTLAEHLRRRAEERGEATFVAACTPEPSVPLEPFTDVLYQLADRYPAQLAASTDAAVLLSLAPELPIAIEQPRSTADRSALFAAIGDALRCGDRPTMVVFEDLHWATPLTLRLLHACATQRGADGPRLTMLCTSRLESSELLKLGTLHLPLQQWSADGVADYLAQFGRPADWTAAAAAWVHRQSSGNALHVRELAMAALDATAAVDAGFVPPAARPDSLAASLERSLRRLTPRARQHLDAAAILGRRFRLAEWQAMIADGERSVDEVIDAHVIVTTDEPGVVEFRHDLLHALVLDAVSDGRRVELHELALDAIISSADISSADIDAAGGSGRGAAEAVPAHRHAELGRHALGAAQLDRARAVAHLVAAAETDTAQFAYEAAIDKYTSALELLSDAESADWCELTMRRGQLLLRLGDDSALATLFSAAYCAIDLGEEVLMARVLREACRLGPTSVVGTVHHEARELLDRVMAAVTDPRADATAATAGVMLYAISGEYERCRAYFDRAAAYVGDDATRIDALSLAVLALNDVDDIERRVAIEAELTQLAARTGSPDGAWGAAHLRLSNQMQLGDPAMRDTLAELGELTRDLRQRTRRWEFTNWSAAVSLIDGDLESADQHATAALECLDAVAESLVMTAYGAQLLAIRMAQGRVAELYDAVAGIVAAGDALGAWHGVLALAAAAAGHADIAREQLQIVTADDLAVLDRDYTFNGALCAAGEAAVLLGDRDAAAIIEANLAPWSGLWSFVGTCTMGPVDLTLSRLAAVLDRPDAARHLAESALCQAERARAPIYAADARRLLA